MANNISSDLIQDVVIETMNTVAGNRLQMFKNCISDFSSEAVQILQNGKPLTAQITLTTDSADTLVNPTNFATTGNKVDARSVACALYTQPFGMNWNDGIKLESVIANNVNKLCDKLVGVFTALLTQTNFGVPIAYDIAGATTADAKDNLFQELFGLLDKGNKKILIACSSLYAKGTPVNQNSFDPTTGTAPRVRGFDGFYENSYLNTGNIKGVVTDGNGIGIISRLPQFSSMLGKAGVSQSNITIENLGITVQFNRWVDTNTRAEHGTFDVVFGAGKYDTSATKLISQSE